MASRKRLAVVLFNLGGPDSPEAVRPFLRNLFRDPAILQVPGPVREILAWLISTLRAPSARKNYAKMGGSSPLLPETEKQAEKLQERLLAALPERDVKIFPAMRYWHPFVEEVAGEVKAWAPDDVVLMPLYPQFSTTTTGSSLSAWTRAFGEGAKTVCCYPVDEGFVAAYADLIRRDWEEVGRPQNVRLLFSAHGLPEKVIDGGDPYQWQVEQSAQAIARRLPEISDWQVCYQSRVGPLKWIGPSTDDAVADAGRERRHILLVPIAFVSEHIETLVELDEEYAELAQDYGAAGYTRVAAVGTHPDYIQGLADQVQAALDRPTVISPAAPKRYCPAVHSACPCREMTRLEHQ